MTAPMSNGHIKGHHIFSKNPGVSWTVQNRRCLSAPDGYAKAARQMVAPHRRPARAAKARGVGSARKSLATADGTSVSSAESRLHLAL